MKFKIDVKKLKDAAWRLGLSTYQLAAASGVPQPTVSAILNGDRSPAPEKLAAICEVLDLNVDDILVKEIAAA